MTAHAPFRCTRCKRQITPDPNSVTAGYATRGTSRRKICFECAAHFDRVYMERHGAIDLHLTESTPAHYCGEVTNWPGTLRFPVLSRKGGRHNIAGSRVDVWFRDHTGARWHGVHLGGMNTIARCKRTGG